MSTILTKEQRTALDGAVQKARITAETAARAALKTLAVEVPSRPSGLSNEDNDLRNALRAKARQLGDVTPSTGTATLTNLEREVAYEQWHRLLFARFLVENHLLMHPDLDIAVSLEDCGELADELGERDAWSVAAGFASQILPGVFRLDEPTVRVRFATEHRLALEAILAGIPAIAFLAEDALGWVYQFWQTAEKKRVNDSGVKIGGADLSSVTQLFTENYMVRFLLENSLGAWWAGKHPDSPLVREWEYLRWLDADGQAIDGADAHTEAMGRLAADPKSVTPAAGTFDEWPQVAREVTAMDPCCGSGHFLVALFGMLWKMRAEEESLSRVDAQDAVLRDNLFGLELDPRCTQIATFNVALEAWKQGGYREVPAPKIACSGISVRQSRAEWLTGIDDPEIAAVMARLWEQFRNADTLGSLIDPLVGTHQSGGRADGAMFGTDMSIAVPWERISGILDERMSVESGEGSVLGHVAQDVVHAAELLSMRYTLVATNPPFLNSQKMSEVLLLHCQGAYPLAAAELAICLLERGHRMMQEHGLAAFVLPGTWLSLSPYLQYRIDSLRNTSIRLLASLGPGSFEGLTGEVVKPVLMVQGLGGSRASHVTIDVSREAPEARSTVLKSVTFDVRSQTVHLGNPNTAITFSDAQSAEYLADYADSYLGIATGDNNRFARKFWELARVERGWSLLAGPTESRAAYGGLDDVLLWEDGAGRLYDFITERLGDGRQGTWIRGRHAWGRRGICLSRAGSFPSSLYTGQLFLDSPAVIVPKDQSDLAAIWCYLRSDEYGPAVRVLNQKVIATVSTMVKVPFDRERWRKVAEGQYPHGLPEPHSDDPTQWLFKGDIASSTDPLQVAVARLLGYRWPDQEDSDLDRFVDDDGIVPLAALPGQGDATSRLRALLSAAYDDSWTPALERSLVKDAGGANGDLAEWLRDTFFAEHVNTFASRPFIWHIWDGRKDGFHALVNYHHLDRATLTKLTYTVLGSYIQNVKADVERAQAGADARLAAAQGLQEKLQLILDGEAPHDVYVRWKPLWEQPVGWSPDLDDGARLNIRPFITAGVLRANLASRVKYDKDRGNDPAGTVDDLGVKDLRIEWMLANKARGGAAPTGAERVNDLHPTLVQRRAARTAGGLT